MIKKINDWYVDYRLDIAYRPSADFKNGRQMVEVYDKKQGYLVVEYFSEDFVKDLYKSADKPNIS